MKNQVLQTKKWWVLIGVSLASFLGCIDFSIVNTALPAIQLGLHASLNQLQWIINIFILALSTCMVIMGRLADIYGRRLLYYIGISLFGLSSLGAGLSANINLLILFRLIQGISCAILYTTTGAIVSNAFPLQERGKALGTLFGINGIGLAIGPVLGGFLVSALSWRWIFLVNVPFIVISLIICFNSVQESYSLEHGTQIDWLGLLTLMIALPCLILGISQGETWGWHSAITIGAFSIAIIMSVLFYLIETRAKSPIIQFHLFANRIFITSIIATAALAFFYCIDFFLMPLYLHNIRNESGYLIGLMLLPTTATIALLSPITGRLVDKYGPKIVLLFGFIFFVLSALLQTQFAENSSLLHVLGAFVLMGIGWACILGPSTVASLSAVPESMGAVAMGSSWTMHNIGGAIGLGLGLAIYHSQAQNALLVKLAQFNIIPGSWMNEIVANPNDAIHTLQRYTDLSSNQIASVFHGSFLAGYSSSMWLLVFSSLTALTIIFFGMKK